MWNGKCNDTKKYCEVESQNFSIQMALIKQQMTKHH